MNFLAHLYLSGNDEDMILGNFIADMVKGRKIYGYDPKIVEGIHLHRKIDRFTDTHPVFRKSKVRLREKYRLYSGVVVDMYYDHFLAKYWSDYSYNDLKAFAGKAYSILKDNLDILPERARFIFPYMVEHNWLVNYADLESLKQNFGGMARRTPFDSGMEEAVGDLEDHYGKFEAEFREFFPGLVSYVQQQGVTLPHHREQMNEGKSS